MWVLLLTFDAGVPPNLAKLQQRRQLQICIALLRAMCHCHSITVVVESLEHLQRCTAATSHTNVAPCRLVLLLLLRESVGNRAVIISLLRAACLSPGPVGGRSRHLLLQAIAPSQPPPLVIL